MAADDLRAGDLAGSEGRISGTRRAGGRDERDSESCGDDEEAHFEVV
jgi:hypothetical protein